MDFAVRQFPHKPCIDRSEKQFAAFCPFAGARNIIKNPLYFGGAEIGVDFKSRRVLYVFFITTAAKFFAYIGGAAALSHDGVANRLTRSFIPHNRRFTLIRDTKRRNL